MNTLTQPKLKMLAKSKAVLLEDYYFKYNSTKFLIPKGFIWDGATIPRFLWSILGLTPFGWVNPASLKHDWIYYLEGKMPEGIYICRKWADEEFVRDLRTLRLIKSHFKQVYIQSLKAAGLYFWQEYYR